jgi:hypothetical protein
VLTGLAYGLIVAGLLYWSIKRGMRLTGSSFKDLMTHNNDDLAIKYFDRMAKDTGNQSGEPDDNRAKKSGSGGGFGELVTEGI